MLDLAAGPVDYPRRERITNCKKDIAMRLFLTILAAIAFVPPLLAADKGAPSNTPAPQWYLDDIAFLTRDGGRWITSNAVYKSESDPMDTYVIEWKAGYAGSMTGRLYGLRGDEETGDFWQMRQYWDPGRGEAVLTQFGFGGAVGIGRAWREDGVNKSAQIFYAPDGTVAGVGHIARNPDADTHVTESFDIIDGEWRPRRSYTWKRDRSAQADAASE